MPFYRHSYAYACALLRAFASAFCLQLYFALMPELTSFSFSLHLYLSSRRLHGFGYTIIAAIQITLLVCLCPHILMHIIVIIMYNIMHNNKFMHFLCTAYHEKNYTIFHDIRNMKFASFQLFQLLPEFPSQNIKLTCKKPVY